MKPQFPGVDPARISKMSQVPVPMTPGTERTISVGCRVVALVSDIKQLMMIGPASYLLHNRLAM
jgi:hypothetical protein